MSLGSRRARRLGAAFSRIKESRRGPDRPDSRREERDSVLAVDTGVHPIASSLRALGGRGVATTWLRRERPYSVMTEATFADARSLVLAILGEAQAQGDVALRPKGARRGL